MMRHLQRIGFGIILSFCILSVNLTGFVMGTTFQQEIAESNKTLVEYVVSGNSDISFDTIQNDFSQQTISLNLPDLEFIELKAWWGPINTSAVGLFVRYGVINTGDEINSTLPVESNLSFFADDNSTHFGYIIQKPLFYPTHWYPGEILGGSFYFDIDEKPTTITVVIDSNESIEESDETNNKMSVPVVDGIRVSGGVYYLFQNERIPVQSPVELKRCDENSLSDFLYRTFRTDEQGYFALSIYPAGDHNLSRIYSLTATELQANVKCINQTPSLRAGQEAHLNFVFNGSAPERPMKPFGWKYGGIHFTYRFISASMDPDAHKIYYKFDWDDDSNSIWLGPYKSGEAMEINHIWYTKGIYNIRVKARDEHGLESDWSDIHSMKISRIRGLTSSFIWWILDKPLVIP